MIVPTLEVDAKEKMAGRGSDKWIVRETKEHKIKIHFNIVVI